VSARSQSHFFGSSGRSARKAVLCPNGQRREGSPGVENTGKTTVAEFVRIRNARKSSEFSRIRLRKSFTALPNGAEHTSPGQSEAGVPANVAPGAPDPEHVSPERAKQNSLGVCSALSGLCSFVDSQPGASLAAHAASLRPRLICSAPSGQCPSLHVNRRAFRKIRSRALPPDEPFFHSPSQRPQCRRIWSVVSGQWAKPKCRSPQRRNHGHAAWRCTEGA
jgi:hypothetical protein